MTINAKSSHRWKKEKSLQWLLGWLQRYLFSFQTYTSLPRDCLHLFLGLLHFIAFLIANNSSLINSSVLHKDFIFPCVLLASVTSSLAAGSRFPLGCFSLSTLQLIYCIAAIARFFHSFCPAPRQFRFLKGFLKGVLPWVLLGQGGDVFTTLKLLFFKTQW